MYEPLFVPGEGHIYVDTFALIYFGYSHQLLGAVAVVLTRLY